MTEAPDVYPEDFDVDAPGSDQRDVEGRVHDDLQAEPLRTGDERVDAVLASVDGLDERPVREHAEVFERAHEELRAALEPDRESA